MKYAKLIYKNVIFFNIFQYLVSFMYKLQIIGNFRVQKWIKGTVSRDFLYLVFSSNSSSWSYQRCPWAVSNFDDFSRSYSNFKTTPRCIGHQGVNQKTLPRKILRTHNLSFWMVINSFQPFFEKYCFIVLKKGFKDANR